MTPDNQAKEKSKEIQALLKEAVEKRNVLVKHISAFGIIYDRAFWIAVETDAERDKLNDDTAFLNQLNAIVKDNGYVDLIHNIWEKEEKPELEALNRPEWVIKFQPPGIEVESQETVDRDFKGNWYHCMK